LWLKADTAVYLRDDRFVPIERVSL